MPFTQTSVPNSGGEQEDQIQENLASDKAFFVYSRRLRVPQPNSLSNSEVCLETDGNGSMERLATNKTDDLDIPITLRKLVKSCTN